MQTAKIEIGSPRLFGHASFLMIWAYGALLFFPVLLSFAVISLMPFGILTILIPSAMIALTAWFVPLGQGNPYIARRMKPFQSQGASERSDFLVQLTLGPRIRTGFRATLEDADDFGFLSFTEAGLVFRGDSVQLNVPYENIARVHRQNVGLRGLFVCGPRITLEVQGLPNVEFIEFAERSSARIPDSKKISGQLLERLQRAVPRK